MRNWKIITPDDYYGAVGTKFASGPQRWYPETLGERYDKIIEQLGEVYLIKPKPGDSFQKLKKPLKFDIDNGYFRSMPEYMIITQPSRLFRSHAWRYKGTVSGDADLFWNFQCKFWNPDYENFGRTPIEEFNRYTGDKVFIRGWEYVWMPVFVLSNCYMIATNEVHKNPTTKHILKLK